MTQDDYAAIGRWLARGIPTAAGQTMASIMLGAKSGDLRAPLDYFDFRDCYRLVQECPAIIDHFQQIIDVAPSWFGPLYHWDELCEILVKAESQRTNTGGFTHKLTLRLQALRS
ncbi:hypothetical protein ACYPKM_01685 [Pseudomonas aeruginosa]